MRSPLCYALAVLVALMSLPTGMSAETHYKPHISLGVRGGVTFSEMAFSPNVKQSFLMGSAGAVTFRYSEEKIFGVIAEFGWSQRGWEENFEGAPISYSRQLTYLKLPLLTHIYFGSRRFKCFVNLGPEFSMMIGEKIRSDFDYRNPFDNPDFPSRNRQVEQMWTDIHNKFDYGITAGIGFEFYVQPRHSITLECRYYYGLGNIFPASKADTFGASRPTDIEATIGYSFRIK